MINFFKKKSVGRIVDIVALLLCIAVALIVCANKCGMHEDEYYSYYSSNRTDGLWLSEEVNAQTFLNELEVLEGQGFNFALVKEVQSWDVHPPVYYFVLHFVCSLSKGHFSMWQGLVINIICYVMSLLLMKIIGTKLIRRFDTAVQDYEETSIGDYVVTLTCLCFGLSSAILTAVVFIRMYMLLTVWILAITLLHVVGLEHICITGKELNIVFYIALGVLTFLGFMTHYYFFIWIFFLAVGFVIWDFCRRENQKLIGTLKYGITQVVTVVLCYIFYPSWPAQMFKGQRGAQATGNFFDISNTFQRFGFFAEKVNRIGFGGIGWIVIILTVSSITFLTVTKKVKIRDFTLEIILLFTWLFYFLTISKTALMLGDSSIRYQMPVLGVAYLVCAVCLYRFASYMAKEGERHRKSYAYALSFIGVILLVMNIRGDICGNISFLFSEEKENMMIIEDHLQAKAIYIYDPAQEWCVWAQAAEIMALNDVVFLTESMVEESIVEYVGEIDDTETVLFVDSSVDHDMAINKLKTNHPQFSTYDHLYDGTYSSVYLGH